MERIELEDIPPLFPEEKSQESLQRDMDGKNTLQSNASIISLPIEEDAKTQPPGSLSAYIIKHPVRAAKNKTFYLDLDVVTTIKKVAKQQKTTESRLVNDILRGILGI